MAERLTRAERKADTRERLLRSAVEVLARRGMERASIDEVAQHAGFTKGAFYAHFASKEELFLSLLDQHFADILGRIDAVVAGSGDLEDQARQGAEEFIRFISADPDWERLFFDFSSYATRNEGFRVQLAERRGALRKGIAEVLHRRVEELGLVPPVPVDHVALMLFAMADGIALARLLDPDTVAEETYPVMLATFFTGLRAGARG